MTETSEAGRETVLVVDDDDDARRILEILLRASGYHAVGFPSAEAFLASAYSHHPACMVLDMNMPGLSGAELQDLAARRGIRLAIVFLTAFGDIALGVNAMKKGAVDFLEKPARPDVLLAAVRQGLETIRESLAESREREAWTSRVARLTERERTVLREVLDGRLNKQVASRLGLAERTVKHHRANAMAKLEAASVAEVARLVERFGALDAGGTPTP
ncbi:MAG: response regulator transcription factor [Holophagales bacterium]|nr:MAG: response regulator transcription factor [Holophagales bacterium]